MGIDDKMRDIIRSELEKMGGYSYYGFTAKEASLKGIKLLEYLRVENEELYNVAKEIPADLSEWIDGFDLIWVIPMSKTYVERRNITDFLAFRELFQNALDAEHEAKGYDNISVKVYRDNLGTHIVDSGRGLPWRGFTIGASEKPVWMRGHFGEGLNLAVLCFGSRGYPVYFFTKNLVYKTFYYPEADSLIVVFGRGKNYVNGTHVLIYHYAVPDDYIRLYWKNNPEIKVVDCVYINEMPNHIFIDSAEKKRLFVRDIFVNTIDEIRYRNSLFSYNIWWVELDPNRTQVRSSFELSRQIGRVIASSQEAMKILLSSIIEEKDFEGRKYYAINDELLEADISYPPPVEEVKKVIEDTVTAKGITCVDYSKDLRAIVPVTHEGGVVLIAPGGMNSLFNSILPDAFEFVERSMSNTIGKAIILDERTLRLDIRKRYAKVRILSEYIKQRDHRFGGVKVVPIKGRSHATSNAIYVDVGDASDFEVFAEELAHAFGMQAFGEADHATREFEKSLYNVVNYAIEMSTDIEASRAFKRIEKGAVNAKLQLISDTVYEIFPNLQTDDHEILDENLDTRPGVYLVINYDRVFFAIPEPFEEITFLINSDVLDINSYMEEVDKVINKLKKDIYEYVKNEISPSLYRWQRIFYKYYRYFKAGHTFYFVVYDIENDEYFVKEKYEYRRERE